MRRILRKLKGDRFRVIVDVVRDPGPIPEGVSTHSMPHARTAARAFKAFRLAMALPLQKEAFLCMFVDAKHKPIAFETISMGSLQSSIVHPREVFKGAVALSASAVVVCHNHPSGDSNPSCEDDDVTNRLREAGRILGIPLLDHLILGEEDFYSFASERKHSYKED